MVEYEINGSPYNTRKDVARRLHRQTITIYRHLLSIALTAFFPLLVWSNPFPVPQDESCFFHSSDIDVSFVQLEGHLGFCSLTSYCFWKTM